MGGGAGTRLFPLTKERSKPAVPLGGKYRLVDIPISNCLNSGLRGEDFDEARREVVELVGLVDVAVERLAVELREDVNTA
ncbi:MAG: sugar phosphate nucleotidyltransferase [Spartobacteria bacterium]